MRFKKVKFILILIFGLSLVWPVFAFEIKETYPRIANYYLQPNIPQSDYDDLSKYDLLILDVDTQTIDPEMFSIFKENNQDIKILAYIPSQSVNTQDLSSWARFRNLTYNEVEDNDWWLRDSQGNKIGFSDTWPTIKFVDPGQGWSDYLSDLIAQDVISRNIWDGIFYDMVFANLSWLHNGDIDINQDGQKDSTEEVNAYWQLHMADLMDKTKQKIKDSPLVANLDIVDNYQAELNGVMMENFPAQWLGDNSWSILINHYLNNLPFENQSPQIYIINSNTNNTGVMDNYRQVRFGLASVLLGDGYFSFDYGDQSHNQVWWYDEYNVNLGKSLSKPQNLLDQANSEIKPGLWRRDFEQGIVLVNSTDQKQTYVFNQEEFEKINGSQDRRINNGTKVNWISLEPKDGILLLKVNREIRNNLFVNGSFVRVFDKDGRQTQTGFFSYDDNFLGKSKVLITKLNNDNLDNVLTNQDRWVYIYKEGELFDKLDTGFININELSIAVGNLTSDQEKQIVVSPSFGGGPHVKVFSAQGQLISEFMAYDNQFRGGVNIATGDIDGDGLDEIITGPGPGGGPHVKVFSAQGQLISEFMAYAESFRNGITVMADDMAGDNLDEILAAIINY